MKLLPAQKPTPEQVPIIARNQAGNLLIRGAAGSGKTTTALLRLRTLATLRTARRQRVNATAPVRVLVLTFNRTLQGYVAALAAEQVKADPGAIHLEVSTFARWAVRLTPKLQVEQQVCEGLLWNLCAKWGWDPAGTTFLTAEVEYVLGRWGRGRLDEYLTANRIGRGTSPQMPAARRQRFLDEIVRPYLKEKDRLGVADWNDVAEAAIAAKETPWDVVVIDEAQDFSAMQLRAVVQHLAADNSLTLVMDTAQRIYPRGFTWREAGIAFAPGDIVTLESNHRNTAEIAAFAIPIVNGLAFDENAALPNFSATTRHGAKPVVMRGKFGRQMAWAIENVVKPANADGESVAFLHPLGGNWFAETVRQLKSAGIDWVEITRKSSWPSGSENVAISTLHSAKGLEFDHVIIAGLNQEVTRHGDEDGDTAHEQLRRLLAMGVGRARISVTVGYKPGEESSLVSFLDPSTYRLVGV